MNKSKPRPFQGLTFRQWWRLCTVSILLTYILILSGNIYLSGIFNYVGLDFRTYYSSAQIAMNEGFSKIYDLDLQRKYQQPLYEDYLGATPANVFETVPTPYFPIFILPFVIFLSIPPNVGFALFTSISAIAFIVTTIHLSIQFKLTEDLNWTVLSALAVLPLFFNLFFGQINVFLYIALAGSLLQIKNKNYLVSGLFLSFWLIKPQMLIFILPWLLFTGNLRILAGFIIGSVVNVISSTILARGDWITPWFNLLFLYPSGLATTNPLAMMNWRGLGLNLETIIPSKIAWGIAYTGMLITFFYMCKTWYTIRTVQTNSQYAFGVLSTYAATCAITWHSHIHMALPLIAPIVILFANKEISYQAWSAFIGLQFLGFTASFILQIWFPENNILSLTILVINVYITQWTANRTSIKYKG